MDTVATKEIAKYYGIYLTGMTLAEYVAGMKEPIDCGAVVIEPSLPLVRIVMPCGERIAYSTFKEMPKRSVRCPCGDKKHWLLKYGTRK